MANFPGKGDRVVLEVSQEGSQRVVCGLRWDPNTEQAKGIGNKLKEMQGQNVSTFDLDLTCIMYNEYGDFVDGVTGRSDEMADESGEVYHSGDDTAGIGDMDDESVSANLKNLPENIHHLYYVVEIQSQHTFADVTQPSVRVADGASDSDLLHIPLTSAEGLNTTACIFAHIYREGDKWMLHNISKYLNGADIDDWTETLKDY